MKINWKNAEVVLAVILAIQILVMLIDLDTKNRIVHESIKLREAIENGKGIPRAANKRNRPNRSNHVSFPGSVVDNGAAGLAKESPSSEGPGDDESFTTPIEERET